jgi:hypothetical protein
MRCPQKLFGATVETPQVDPSNLILLQQHVVCAAVELPLVPRIDESFFGTVCGIMLPLCVPVHCRNTPATRAAAV